MALNDPQVLGTWLNGVDHLAETDTKTSSHPISGERGDNPT